mmetsp:Transcript_14049/g.38645  ORF Transcript_14049/g.38645 Transcript_14049/m.38645 type:complete len:207 (+) Transcript_14049:3-623(+)
MLRRVCLAVALGRSLPRAASASAGAGGPALARLRPHGGGSGVRPDARRRQRPRRGRLAHHCCRRQEECGRHAVAGGRSPGGGSCRIAWRRPRGLAGEARAAFAARRRWRSSGPAGVGRHAGGAGEFVQRIDGCRHGRDSLPALLAGPMQLRRGVPLPPCRGVCRGRTGPPEGQHAVPRRFAQDGHRGRAAGAPVAVRHRLEPGDQA